jgi:hypothetical protein
MTNVNRAAGPFRSGARFGERLTVRSCPSLSHLRFEAAASLRKSLEAKFDLWPVRDAKRACTGPRRPCSAKRTPTGRECLRPLNL